MASDIPELKSERGYFYIIKTADSPEGVYKIGMTRDVDPNKRLCKYPKYSCVKFTIEVENASVFEDIVMQKFQILFARRKELGLEYYEGDWRTMVQYVYNLWTKYGHQENPYINKKISNIKPNGWQYFVNEWLCKNPGASPGEAYAAYVDLLKKEFGIDEYASLETFICYFRNMQL